MTELEALRDRVAELEEACGLRWAVPPAFKTSRRCRLRPWQVLCFLAKRGHGRQDAIFAAIWGDLEIDERPEPNIVKVIVCVLRGFLRGHGIEIETVRGDVGGGYRFSPDMRRRALALIEQLRTEGES